MTALVQSEVNSSSDSSIGDVGNQCPSLNMTGTGSDVQAEEKYWRLKLLYNALESVIFDPNQANFTPETLHQFRLVFHSDGTTEETTTELQDKTISPNTEMLKTLVAREIKYTADSLIKSGSELLNSSHTERSGDKITGHKNNSLEALVDMIEKRKKEELELDEEIRQLELVRKEETRIFQNTLYEVKLDLENLKNKASSYKEPQLMNKILEALKFRCDILMTKTEIVKKEQLLAQNPPDLTTQIKATKVLLSAASDELRQEISTKSAFLQQYDSLTPDVLEVLSELRSTEEAIQRQEWIKKKLVGFNSMKPEDSFNESLTDF